jgi:diaminobutyrate-2-oxoglutarate transaminase
MDFETLSLPGAPAVVTPPPGPASRAILELQARLESSAVSYPRGLPMAIRRGKGATVEDVDGNLYLDFFAGAGVLNLGHANPDVLAAARTQLEEVTHTLDIPTPARISMVEALRDVLPEELGKLFFGGPTGSDAVEAAVKLAKYNTKRVPVLAFEGSYHGMTSGALSLCSGAPFKEDFLPLLGEVHFAPYAYCYRCPFGRAPETCSLECAAFVEHLLEDPHSGVAHPAAVLVEPIQGEGGSIVPKDGFIQKVREACDRHGVVLIFDEIQAGFCRTGRMFSFEHFGVVPDIMTMSKALGGGGFPISALAFRAELDTWPPGKHIGTFRGNMIAYAAGAAGIRFMLAHDVAAHAAGVGEVLLGMLKEVEAESEVVGEARGKGLMLGMEMVEDKATRKPAPELARKVRSKCHQKGMLIEVGGHYFNVARLLPPLILTEAQARKGAEILAEAVREVEAER